MRPLRTSQRIARRHSPTSRSRMGRLFLNMLMAAGLWGRPVVLSLKRGFLRTRRMWTIRLILFLYSLNSQSWLRPESITHPMYLPLLTAPSWIHQRKVELPYHSAATSLCSALRQILQNPPYLSLPRLVKCHEHWKLSFALSSYTQRLTLGKNKETSAENQKPVRITKHLSYVLKMQEYLRAIEVIYNLLTL